MPRGIKTALYRQSRGAVGALSAGWRDAADVVPAPTLGEHNDAVPAGDLGLSRGELDKLAADGVIATRAIAS